MSNKVIEKFRCIRNFKKGGKLARHKPLLLLYALSRLKNDKARVIKFDEAEKVVQPLITKYSPFNSKAVVAYPFKRLENDGIWWLGDHTETSSGDILVKEARDNKLEAGFSEDIVSALSGNPALIDIISLGILDEFFQPSLHQDVLDALGLELGNVQISDSTNRKRDPRFRKEVLVAYYEQCCVCEHDLRLKGAPVALEAAHIMMHSVGGEDSVNNGLALCSLHHKLFDLGAITIDQELKIRVSQLVAGNLGRKLTDDFHEKEILLPRDNTMRPAGENISWHNTQIFQGKLT